MTVRSGGMQCTTYACDHGAGGTYAVHVCALQVAFASDGAPSKALDGFCRKNGVAAADVTVEADVKGTEYVWAVVQQCGRVAAEVWYPVWARADPPAHPSAEIRLTNIWKHETCATFLLQAFVTRSR